METINLISEDNKHCKCCIKNEEAKKEKDKEKLNFWARQYYYRKLNKDPEYANFIKEKGRRQRERRNALREVNNLPKPKIGRPKKIIIIEEIKEVIELEKEQEKQEPPPKILKKRGAKPKYPLESYKL